MKHSVRKNAVCLCAVICCVLLFSCTESSSQLYHPSDAANTSAAEQYASDTPLGNTINEILGQFLAHGRKAEEFSDLGIFRLANPADGTNLDSMRLPIADGTMQADLNVLIFSAQQKTEIVSGLFVLIWNGQVYDFSVDGKPSENGACSVTCRYNQDVSFSFWYNISIVSSC